MNSRQLLAVVVALAVLGEGYWLFTRRPSSTDAREAPTIEHGAASNAEAESPPALLPIPAPVPELDGGAAAKLPDDESQREAAPPAPAQDFESKYRLKTLDELRDAQEQMNKQEFAAAQARLEELWPKFSELLANGEYGARLVAPGTETTHSGTGSWTMKAGGVKSPDGKELMQIIEFENSTEPATAALHAENEWLRARISTRKKGSPVR